MESDKNYAITISNITRAVNGAHCKVNETGPKKKIFFVRMQCERFTEKEPKGDIKEKAAEL